jgi:SAM-dependent methyltransferase
MQAPKNPSERTAVVDPKTKSEAASTSANVTVCRVCGSDQASNHYALPETMFSTAEHFDYWQCQACECLQITNAPSDMAPYYPGDYYSYSPRPKGLLASMKANIRAALSIFGPSQIFAGRDWYEKGDRKSLRDAKVRRADRILDLGCGQGALVADLRDIGFENVIGADPFVDEDVKYSNGAVVLKRDGSELDGPFDLVMMHHSLEHIWDQKQAVTNIARLLTPGGRCIIRIPTIDSWAWGEYGEDWVQLDPPRHFYLHSRRSIALLLEQAGLKVTAIIDDSIAFQILASEQIRFGKEISSRSQATAKARELNKIQRGDSIAIHAMKPVA